MSGWRRRGKLLAYAIAASVAGAAALALISLVLLRWIDPPTTALQAQRRVEAWLDGREYVKRREFVPLDRISKHLHHAVVAAEDARFYEHAGIDWQAIGEAIEDNRERAARRRRPRGGSTLSQQLVKNLFLTTRGGIVRKVFEVPLTYAADAVLPKDRILELYLNVIEWGDGIYGAEAASRHHFGVSAARLSRVQAAALAACIPAPRRRVPARMGSYRDVILERMQQMGW